MLAEHNLTNLPEDVYLFKGNEPLLLDERKTVWLVKSGSLALFVINVEGGIPKGKRDNSCNQ
jgi:hypothetical protein